MEDPLRPLRDHRCVVRSRDQSSWSRGGNFLQVQHGGLTKSTIRER